MTGQAHWFPVVMVLAGGALVLLLGYFLSRVGRRLRSELQRPICPRSGEEVEALLTRDPKTGCWTGVQRCSAFEDPEDVQCDRACVDELNARFQAVSSRARAVDSKERIVS